MSLSFGKGNIDKNEDWVKAEVCPEDGEFGLWKEGFATEYEEPSLKEEKLCGAIGAKRTAQNYEKKHLVSVRIRDNTYCWSMRWNYSGYLRDTYLSKFLMLKS